MDTPMENSNIDPSDLRTKQSVVLDPSDLRKRRPRKKEEKKRERIKTEQRKAYVQRVGREVTDQEYKDWVKQRKWRASRLYSIHAEGRISLEEKTALLKELNESTIETIKNIRVKVIHKSKVNLHKENITPLYKSNELHTVEQVQDTQSIDPPD